MPTSYAFVFIGFGLDGVVAERKNVRQETEILRLSFGIRVKKFDNQRHVAMLHMCRSIHLVSVGVGKIGP